MTALRNRERPGTEFAGEPPDLEANASASGVVFNDARLHRDKTGIQQRPGWLTGCHSVGVLTGDLVETVMACPPCVPRADLHLDTGWLPGAFGAQMRLTLSTLSAR